MEINEEEYEEDDKNCIFVARIRIPTNTSISAAISGLINFSLKNTIAKRIENKIERFNVQVAPNPAIGKSTLYINSNSAAPVMATVEMINAQGLLVYKQSLKVSGGTNTHNLAIISRLAPGRYVVRITTDNESYSEPLLITK